MQLPYFDLHCHPSMKPYGKSFKRQQQGIQANSLNNKASLWFYDSPNLFERALQMIAGITKFTQSDLSSLAFGNVRVVCGSLYPIERGFFLNKMGQGIKSDLVSAFATGVGKRRVDFIQGNSDYFSDLLNEYEFYLSKANQQKRVLNETYKYILARDFDHVERVIDDEENTLIVVMTIEGMHAAISDIDNFDTAQTIQNTREIKNWDHPPFFVTLAHHFNNHLCGHARSLYGLVDRKTDQSENLNEGIFPAGLQVIDELLDRSTGRRILIDIKHMSALAREEYMALVLNRATDPENPDHIPIIISHGAANGLRSRNEPVVDLVETGSKMNQVDINFYDNEIVAVADSGGIIGLQLDERRIASKSTLKRLRNAVLISKLRHYRSSLLWNQIQHILELLDREGMFAWDCISIGSDFDGIIDPLNGFLTSETLVHLEEYVERHAFNYMQDRGSLLLNEYNQIEADEIVHRVFHGNAYEFMRKHFRETPIV